MEYTIGVVTYNRPECVERLLASLHDQTRPPDEVVVVDDSESEATERVVSAARADASFPVRYERGDPGTAQPGARNQVLEVASGDVVCFVDDDVYCEPTWLEWIHDTYDGADDVVAVGGPAVLTDEALEPLQDWYVTAEEDLNRINRFAEDVEFAEVWHPPDPVETQFLLGANMSFRTDVLEDVGGFDLAFRWGPAYYEETDVMAELDDRDGRVIYHPDVLVCHVQSETGGSRSDVDSTGAPSRFWLPHNNVDPYWFAHNHVIFAAKHSCSLPRSLLRLLVGTEYRPASIARHLVHATRHRDFEELRATLAGYRDGLRRLRRS